MKQHKEAISTWFVINIIARKNQTPQHYIDALTKLAEVDPPVRIRGDNFVNFKGMDYSIEATNGIPSWIAIDLYSYIVVNADAFYNRAKKEKVSMDWDKDIVANVKEATVYFFPSIHKVAVKSSSKIKFTKVQKYFAEALNEVEPDGFNVITCNSQSLIREIKQASEIIQLKTTISFSNPTHSEEFDSFERALDDKIRDANPERVELNMYGSRTSPLEVKDDGLVSAALALAEDNGSFEALVRKTEGAKPVRLDSKKHPKKIELKSLKGNFVEALYNLMTSLFDAS